MRNTDHHHYFIHGGHRYLVEDFFRPHYTLAPPTEITIVQPQAVPDVGTVIGVVGALSLAALFVYLLAKK